MRKEQWTDHAYTFGDVNIISRVIGIRRPVYQWFWLCDGCRQRIPFKLRKPKIWEAECWNCKMILTVTPWEYAILKPQDFTKIMGGG